MVPYGRRDYEEDKYTRFRPVCQAGQSSWCVRLGVDPTFLLFALSFPSLSFLDITSTTVSPSASSSSASSSLSSSHKKKRRKEKPDREDSLCPSLPTHLLATGGDMLAVFDLRKKTLYARSDPFEEDFHCVQVMRVWLTTWISARVCI